MGIEWFALIAQFFLAMENRAGSAGEAIGRFFSYFTVLSNGLAAVAFTTLLLTPGRAAARWFARPSVLTALTLYMIVVGITYNVVLRGIWAPVGLARLVDELLHTVMPLLVLLFWILCVPKVLIRWLYIPVWLIFPAAYCLFCLGRGALDAWYPYPFLDVNELGLQAVAINIGGMLLLFLGLSVVLVGVSKSGK
jgi:hypothetical protein